MGVGLKEVVIVVVGRGLGNIKALMKLLIFSKGEFGEFVWVGCCWGKLVG
jgi:hypothetical protein